ncbi:F-box protein SKIP22-like [Syzygium oleosum]|uniref:F-box protein SKIP22-like n=1 Tax=Syzygium oleosum TaxID=219896 RepID=UPI0011D230C6|nr:F-box protein SKIP22-like [Syzygium oleosum]
MDSESCHGLGRWPEAAAAAAAADSEMTDLVPGDGQKKADAPISAEGRRNSSSGSVDLDGAADGSAVVGGRAGLPVQSCFAWLPVELKLKILKSLPRIDLARVGCVCSELRDLASNDDLWKQKYVEEFGEPMAYEGTIPWKQLFEKRSWTVREIRRWRANEIRLLSLPLFRI